MTTTVVLTVWATHSQSLFEDVFCSTLVRTRILTSHQTDENAVGIIPVVIGDDTKVSVPMGVLHVMGIISTTTGSLLKDRRNDT